MYLLKRTPTAKTLTMPRHQRGSHHRNGGTKRRHHDNDEYQQQQGNNGEETVDDLLVASMHAVGASSAWCTNGDVDAGEEVIPGADDSSDSSSDDDESSEDSESKGEDENEIVIDEEEEDEKVLDVLPASDKDINVENNISVNNCTDKEENMHVEDDKGQVDAADAHPTTIEETQGAVESEDEGDISDIDLTEQLANMEDDDDVPTTLNNKRNKNKNNKQQNQQSNKNIPRGPRTENEIDIYNCPTSELEKLNVGTLSSESATTTTATQVSSSILPNLPINQTTDNNFGEIAIDDTIQSKLQIAGTVRSYLVEQRTVVVDSFIPSSLQQQHHHQGNYDSRSNLGALDEGSMLVLITLQQPSDESNNDNDDAKLQATTLDKVRDGTTNTTNNNCSLQVLGKIMEVFGPVSRPMYAIRLPDPPSLSSKQEAGKSKPKTDETVVKVGENGKKNDVEVTSATKEEEEEDSKTNDKKQESVVEEEVDPKQCKGDESSNVEASVAEVEVVEKESAMDKDNGDEMKRLSTNNTAECTDANLSEPVSKLDAEKKKIAQSKNIEKPIREDPWSAKGKLSIMLTSNPNAPVYVLKDHAKLIDTDQIIRVSGRGCDASNMYDEEPADNEQQYFSDDEQERMAKRGNRKPRQQTSSNDQGSNDSFQGGSGRSGSGRGVGRDGRGRGRGRGRGGLGGRTQQQQHHGSFGSPQHRQQQQHMQPQYQQQYAQPSYQQTQYQNQYPPQHMQQMPHQNPHPYQQGYPQQPHVYQQQGMYQQQQQPYQPQYQSQQQPPQAYYNGQQTYQYPPQGQAMYNGVPPPPPPPQMSGGMPGQYLQPAQIQQQQQQQTPESDTVYYDYSAS